METRQVIQRIERTAPLSGAADWDVSGVQIAGRRSEVRRIAVALDPLPGIVHAALAWGADFILTHHPLALEPRFLNQLDDYHHVASAMLPAGAWLYAAHTSLDAHPDGPAGWLAHELGLLRTTILEPTPRRENPAPPSGFGIVGDLPATMTWPQFAQHLNAAVDRTFWILCGPQPADIRRVAYCCGSGGALIPAAACSDADIFITGDIKYHCAVTTPLPLVDVGHFTLEESMMRRFAEELAADPELAGVETVFFPGRDPLRIHLPGQKPGGSVSE